MRTIGLSVLLVSFLMSPTLAKAEEVKASYAAVGNITRTPYGWADLCGRQPQECQVDVLAPVDLHLTTRTMAILERINAQVNAEIVPISNLDHWGTVLDHWDYPTDGKGDCKIYALWKRKLLIDLGFPRQALLMTIVRDLEGNGQTILTVKTDRGELVLDNMVGEIRSWDATGYTFVKRQSQSDPNVWVAVGPSDAAAKNRKADQLTTKAIEAKTTEVKATDPKITAIVDQASLFKVPAGTQTLVIGNPTIADVTLLKKNSTMVLTPKALGETNFIALDSKGNPVAESTIQVVSGRDNVIVNRGVETLAGTVRR